MPQNPTGLAWLVQNVLPRTFQGILGRWMLKKLFDALRDRKVLPRSIDQWLKKPVKDLNQVTAEWDPLEALRLVPELGHGTVEASSGDLIQESVRTLILATVGSPKPGKYPKGISTKGKEVWDDIVEDFEKEIKDLGEGDQAREWAAAILLYQRRAKKARIRPFGKGTKRLSPHSGDEGLVKRRVQKRLSNSYKRGFAKLNAALDALPGRKSVLRAMQPWSGKNGYWFAVCYRVSVKDLGREEKKGLETLLKSNFRFRDGNNGSLVHDDARMKHIVRLRKSRREWRLCLEFYMTNREAELMTGEKHRDDILEKLRKVTRILKKEQRIPRSMT